MSLVTPELPQDGALLSAALKAIRRRRGMKSSDVARAMNMALRTYEHFEAGRGRMNLDYIHRFCDATDSDPYGVIMAIAIGSPAFAERCADNKMMTILTIALQTFDRDMGDRTRDEEARTLITAFGVMFDKLDADSRSREAMATRFLQAGKTDLAAKRPKPGR